HIIDSVTADGQIVLLFEAIHVNTECQVLGRFVFIQLSLQENRIRTEVDIALLRNQSFDNLRHFWMNERLATRNTDDRRTALLSCSPTLLRRQPLVQHMVGVLNLAAAGTRQITAE